MYDAFRNYESWLGPDGTTNQKIAEFWTFGPFDSAGTYLITALGMLLMIVAIVGWVWLEHKKLTEQAERLRASGALN